MAAPSVLYALILEWLYALGGLGHHTTCQALAAQVTAVLLGQSVRPAARMRALPSAATVPARQRYRRAARALDRPSLSPARLTPLLVRAALALVGPDRRGLTHLALDSVRCGAWEVLTVGVVWHSRVIPVGWAVLPYPWPKGKFTPTTCRLIEQIAAAWPPDRRAHLAADRGFPSRALFQTLQAVGWDWTVRLRAKSWVGVAGKGQWVRSLLDHASPSRWARYEATFGSGPKAVSGHLVMGWPHYQPPRHQRNPGSARARAGLATRRVQHLQSKHPGRAPDASSQTVAWLVLFTSLSDARLARSAYRRRWATEGSYRDAQGGWDGQHGWDLEPAIADLTQAQSVAHLVGLWALSTLMQTWVGDQVAHGPAPVRLVSHQWATTRRLSIWARGRLALTDPSGDLVPWLQMTLNRGAQRIALALPTAASETDRHPSLFTAAA